MSGTSLLPLVRWLASHCNDDWEHQYGVTISTLDNPGWRVQIDLAETELEGVPFETVFVDRSETDWFRCQIIGRTFDGAGGLGNLDDIAECFQAWRDAAGGSSTGGKR